MPTPPILPRVYKKGQDAAKEGAAANPPAPNPAPLPSQSGRSGLEKLWGTLSKKKEEDR